MSKTILLADDSVTIQKVVELTFMDQDFEVVAVGDGLTALSKLEEISPDMVVADVHMPGADGYEVCRKSKALDPQIPVLLLVGTFEPFDQNMAEAAGADASLKKPFDSQELLRRVEEFTRNAVEAVEDEPTAEFVEPPSLESALEDDIEAVEDPPEGAATDDSSELELELVEDEPEQTDFQDDQGNQEVEPVEEIVTKTVDQEPQVEEIAGAACPADLEVSPPEEATGEVAAEEVAPEPASDLEAPVSEDLQDEVPIAAASQAEQVTAEESQAEEETRDTESHSNGSLSQEQLEFLAKRVADLLGDQVVREVAWEVVPDLAEVIIKERIRELESQVE